MANNTGDENVRGQVVDVNRTGGKCVAGELPDPGQTATAAPYHRTGALRTKPGRGDRTLSLSCSDKILKWSQVGCQVRYVGDKIDYVYCCSFGKGMDNQKVGYATPLQNLPKYPYGTDTYELVPSCC